MKPAIFIPLVIAALSLQLSACSSSQVVVPSPEPGVEPASSTISEPWSTTAYDASYIVVDTGQEKCYNDSREISCPQQGDAFYGQDAQYQGAKPAYRDNGDGTVTDLNTGLMWQQDPGEKVTYDEAVAGADSLTLAGYDDWRLPTIKELYSLIIFTGVDPHPTDTKATEPFIDTDYFVFEYGDTGAGERIIDAQFFSSTKYVSTTMGGNETVFGVNFADGRIKGYPARTTLNKTGKRFVRYVRGNPDYGNNFFVDNNDGTITDTATGLMWSQADSGEGMDWEDALAWVQQKNEESYLGYNDWRLPNAKELQSIVDYTRSPDTTDSAAIDSLFECSEIIDEAGEKDYPFYWSSTTFLRFDGSASFAVYVSFGEGLGSMDGTNVIDVHGAGCQRSDPKSGDPNEFPSWGDGPQGDVLRVFNYVRCVRDAG